MKYINIGIKIDLVKLLETRALILADSGAGKSWLIRKMAEECSGKVQQIIIDPEGDFMSLREKYPFALMSKSGGELPANIRYAEALAHKILETGISVIVDIYELKKPERIAFVKAFTEALVEAPKKIRRSCIVYYDEAQMFCPQDKSAESFGSIIDICTRGRKRGLCAILATHRASIMNNDAMAQCKNKFMGSTSLPDDQKKVAHELGLYDKTEIRNLRNLDNGEFYAFGNAISKEIIKFKVGAVKTTHVKSGKKLKSIPPTPTAIRKILSKLEDIPEEAEIEINTKKALQDEVRRLKNELRVKPAVASTTKLVTVVDEKSKQQISFLQTQLKEEEKTSLLWKKAALDRESLLSLITKQIEKLPGINIKAKKIKSIPVTFSHGKLSVPKTSALAPILAHSPMNKDATQAMSPQSGAMRMLKAAAMFYPGSITRTRMGAFARMSHTSGSFGTYVSSLRTSGYITGDKNEFKITQAGLVVAGDVDPLPTDPQELINLWCGIIGEANGTARMLRKLGEIYPDEMTKEELGDAIGMKHTSGSFGTYLSYLRKRGLIVTTGQDVKASEELFL